MVSNHKLAVSDNFTFMCSDCGKTLKNQEKFEQHCLGHGDPDLECNKCHKVFASKFTLRNHRKIHSRMFSCGYCSRKFSTVKELQAHSSKFHFSLMCELCSFVCDSSEELSAHKERHRDNQQTSSKPSSESDFADGVFEGISDVSVTEDFVKQEKDEHRQTPDSVIAKVMSNKIFRTDSETNKKQRKYNKVCL